MGGKGAWAEMWTRWTRGCGQKKSSSQQASEWGGGEAGTDGIGQTARWAAVDGPREERTGPRMETGARVRRGERWRRDGGEEREREGTRPEVSS